MIQLMMPRGVSPVEQQAQGDFSALMCPRQPCFPLALALGCLEGIPWGMGLSGHGFIACSVRGGVEEVVSAQKTRQ